MPAFASFSQGQDDVGSWSNESPAYKPGRFHAHALPSSSSTPSGSRAPSVTNFPSIPPPGPRPARSRQRSRNRFIRPLFATPTTTEEEGPRSPLLNGFFSSFGELGGAEAIEEAGEDEEEGHGWLRPSRRSVERVMSSWCKRWAVLVGLPCLLIWVWCSVPFPVQDPYQEEPPWHIPWPPTTDPPTSRISDWISGLPFFHQRAGSNSAGLLSPVAKVFWTGEKIAPPSLGLDPQYTGSAISSQLALQASGDRPRGGGGDQDLPVDANFLYFLLIYYGAYLATGLVFITKLFDLCMLSFSILNRLNWWPSALGGSVSYVSFWLLSLLVGFLLHYFDLDGFGRRTRSRTPRESDEWDWERKTTWVLLAFATMALPALACFVKLKADRRGSFRRSLTPAQKIFLERQLAQRMPRSYRRFLWFIGTLGLSLLALIIGQGFAALYLSTLPHSNIEGLVYVYTWILTINILNAISSWMLQRKVRSHALVFVFRFYHYLLFHVFYRNLFARLKSPDQAVWITLLSSSVVIVVYPVTMSRTFWRILRWAVGLNLEWEDYAAEKGQELYLRNLSEVVTMVAFLGWLSILHWGPNKAIYPFFAFDNRYDPYTYRLTLTASLVVFAAELFSSYIARLVCWVWHGVDVTNIGLDQFREHPELVIACVFTSCHVLSDMLLFLVKLNFR